LTFALTIELLFSNIVKERYI